MNKNLELKIFKVLRISATPTNFKPGVDFVNVVLSNEQGEKVNAAYLSDQVTGKHLIEELLDVDRDKRVLKGFENGLNDRKEQFTKFFSEFEVKELAQTASEEGTTIIHLLQMETWKSYAKWLSKNLAKAHQELNKLNKNRKSRK